MIKSTIVNMVVTADLKQKVDLELVWSARLAEYNPKKYGGRVAYFKTKTMNAKVSLFKSGKMISIGNKSLTSAIHDLNLVRDILEEKNLITPVKLAPLIQNIVFSVKFDLDLDLEMIAKESRMIYEPEQFPGAIIRIDEPNKAVVLLFASGKAVVVGLKDPDKINGVCVKMVQIIKGGEKN